MYFELLNTKLPSDWKFVLLNICNQVLFVSQRTLKINFIRNACPTILVSSDSHTKIFLSLQTCGATNAISMDVEVLKLSEVGTVPEMPPIASFSVNFSVFPNIFRNYLLIWYKKLEMCFFKKSILIKSV